MSYEKLLRCPRCQSALRLAAGSLRCTSCTARFPRNGRIIDLRRDSPGPEIPREHPPSSPGIDDWPKLVREHVSQFQKTAEALYDVAAQGRVAWKILLNLPPQASVLDLRPGTGLVASSVAPHVARVVAASPIAASLHLAAQRFRLFNESDDVVLVVTEDDELAPFQDGSFDCVLLSGLDTGPTSADGRTSPRPDARYLRRRLAEIERVLRSGGQLFWVEDNPFGRKQWRRALRRLLERPTSARRVDLTTKPPTFGYVTYRRALRSAGFSGPRWFSLVGDESSLHRIVPATFAPPLHQSVTTTRRVRTWLEAQVLTASRYGILVTKNGASGESILNRLLQDIERRLDLPRPSLEAFTISRKDKIILRLQAAHRVLIVRIPLTGAARQSELTNVSMLRALASAESLRTLIPLALTQGEIGGAEFFVESFLEGSPLSDRLANIGLRPANPVVAELLTRVTESLGSVRVFRLEGEQFERDVTSPLGSLHRLGVEADIAARLTAYFMERLHGVALPYGVLHGDFSTSNIFLDDRNRVCGLIDWEGGAQSGLSIFDAIHYVESVERRMTGDDIGVAIPRMARGHFVDEAMKQFLTDSYTRLGIDARHHETLVYLKWLRHMAYLSNFWLAYDQKRIDTIVTPVVKSILGGA